MIDNGFFNNFKLFFITKLINAIICIHDRESFSHQFENLLSPFSTIQLLFTQPTHAYASAPLTSCLCSAMKNRMLRLFSFLNIFFCFLFCFFYSIPQHKVEKFFFEIFSMLLNFPDHFYDRAHITTFFQVSLTVHIEFTSGHLLL